MFSWLGYMSTELVCGYLSKLSIAPCFNHLWNVCLFYLYIFFLFRGEDGSMKPNAIDLAIADVDTALKLTGEFTLVFFCLSFKFECTQCYWADPFPGWFGEHEVETASVVSVSCLSMSCSYLTSAIKNPNQCRDSFRLLEFFTLSNLVLDLINSFHYFAAQVLFALYFIF